MYDLFGQYLVHPKRFRVFHAIDPFFSTSGVFYFVLGKYF